MARFVMFTTFDHKTIFVNPEKVVFLSAFGANESEETYIDAGFENGVIKVLGNVNAVAAKLVDASLYERR